MLLRGHLHSPQMSLLSNKNKPLFWKRRFSKQVCCTGLEKAPAWNKLVAGNSPRLELARSKMVSPRAWKMLFPGLHSRLEKQAGWKKALAGNDSWLEQGLCESKK